MSMQKWKKSKKHGPYYNLSYTHKGRGTSEYIPEIYVDELKKKNNKLYKNENVGRGMGFFIYPKIKTRN